MTRLDLAWPNARLPSTSLCELLSHLPRLPHLLSASIAVQATNGIRYNPSTHQLPPAMLFPLSPPPPPTPPLFDPPLLTPPPPPSLWQ